ncbi:sulfotransferase 1A1-like [Macrobrachium rosenbergii]|uniref:sulfotransferase 1A1-like n=1 Tax=Macrobrachium rosenbergii TaxID=79674 RepID=UPI0034D64053
MQLDSGHDYKVFDEEKMEHIRKNFKGFEEPLIRLNPGGWVLPKEYLKFANKIYNFEIRDTDVMVMTFPKCGTTWAQEIIWTMRNSPNLDHPWASKPPLTRSPFMDYDMLMGKMPEPGSSAYPIYEMFLEMCPGKNPNDGINVQLAEYIPDPRTIKSHLPFSLMPPSMLDTAKVVYVARNPKDVIVSYHHFYKLMEETEFVGQLEDFLDLFVNDDLIYGPYWLHLKEAWERRDHPNLHIIFFEGVKENVLKELEKLNDFLGTNLTEEQLKGIAEYTSFENMRRRGNESREKNRPIKRAETEVSEEQKRKLEYVKKEGGFFRKGVVGDWKNRLTPEMSAKVDRWVRDHLSNLGVNFRYGIGH